MELELSEELIREKASNSYEKVVQELLMPVLNYQFGYNKGYKDAIVDIKKKYKLLPIEEIKSNSDRKSTLNVETTKLPTVNKRTCQYCGRELPIGKRGRPTCHECSVAKKYQSIFKTGTRRRRPPKTKEELEEIKKKYENGISKEIIEKMVEENT